MDLIDQIAIAHNTGMRVNITVAEGREYPDCTICAVDERAVTFESAARAPLVSDVDRISKVAPVEVAPAAEFDVSDFHRGHVRAVHRVGSYVIVEHDRIQAHNVSDDDFVPGVLFSPFVPPQTPVAGGALRGGVYDCRIAFESLDEALVHCVAFTAIWRNQGYSAALNTQAVDLIMRMIGQAA